MTRRTPLALVGPTAVGKTELSLALAESLGAEIVSVDSMLVYRGMDVGTAKPTVAERARVPHHLIDVAEPSEAFSVARFQEAGRQVLREIDERGSEGLLVGGSGLYFRAVVDDLEFPGTDPDTRTDLERQAAALGPERMYERLASMDPVAAARIEPGNVRRIVRALEVPADHGTHRSRRSPRRGSATTPMRSAPPASGCPASSWSPGSGHGSPSCSSEGWLDEVRSLVDAGFGGWLTSTQAIGYAELARHLRGEMTLDDAVEATVKRTTNLARRQMAWFRRDPRIRWFDVDERGAMSAFEAIRAFLSRPWEDE